MAAVAACRAVWRRGRAIAAAHRHASRLPGAGQVVVTEDTAADAYTVPGWPCRIVITQGMLRALSAGERGVLLAHERSHARGSHYLFTSAARLAAAANPLLRPVAAQAGYTVERWADERAASQAGDRTLAARAVAHAALATSAAPPGRDAAMTALGLITQEGETPGTGYQRPACTRVDLHGPARCRAASPRCSPRRPGCGCSCWSPRSSSSPSPAPPPWRPPANFHQLIELAQGPPA